MQDNTAKKHKYVSRYVSRFSTESLWQETHPKNRYLYIGINCTRFRPHLVAENRPQKFRQNSRVGVFTSKKIFRDTRKCFLPTMLRVPVMKQLRTPAEVCQYLRISRTVLYRMEKDGELLPFRFRGKVFYEQADIDAYLDSKKVSYRTLPSLGESQTAKAKQAGSAITNGVIANMPISPRSNRSGYFATPVFGTAVAEIDRNFQQGGSNQ